MAPNTQKKPKNYSKMAILPSKSTPTCRSQDTKEAIKQELKRASPTIQTQEEHLFAMYYSKAAISTHIALLHTVIRRYAKIVEINPEL